MHETTIATLIAREQQRQREGLELIPSENYVSGDVLRALGSVFTINIGRVTQAGVTMAGSSIPTK